MKKTQPIDWDNVMIYSYADVDYIVAYFPDYDTIYLDKDFIAAFDEMLEEQMKIDKFMTLSFYRWNDTHGWVLDLNKWLYENS